MKLHELLIKAHELLNDATIEFELTQEAKCKELLGSLYDLLDDEVGSGARDKCESAESSDGS